MNIQLLSSFWHKLWFKVVSLHMQRNCHLRFNLHFIWSATAVKKFMWRLVTWIVSYIQRAFREEVHILSSISNCPICVLCHNFWTNQGLDLISTSKWPSEPQFSERKTHSWLKMARKGHKEPFSLSFSFRNRVYNPTFYLEGFMG